MKEKGWGLRPKAHQPRMLQAFQDLRLFQSSLHLLANKIGAWRVRLNGTLSAMILGWVAHFLFRCTQKFELANFATDRDFYDGSDSEAESEQSPASKRKKSAGQSQSAAEPEN